MYSHEHGLVGRVQQEREANCRYIFTSCRNIRLLIHSETRDLARCHDAAQLGRR